MKWQWVRYISRNGAARWEAQYDADLGGAVKLKVTELNPIRVNGRLTALLFPVEVRVSLGPASVTLNASINDEKLALAMAERLAEVVLTPEFKAQVHKACMETS